VTLQEAALWTDGRYYLQASQQLDKNWQLMKAGLPETPTIADWLNKVQDFFQFPQKKKKTSNKKNADSSCWRTCGFGPSTVFKE
jgi:hypothetical protein